MIDRLRAKCLDPQFLRYLLVGAWNTLFAYATYCLLTWLLTGIVPYAYMAAAVLGNFINITVAFLGYKFFVFRTRGNFLREYVRCFTVYGTSSLVNLALLPFVVEGIAWLMADERPAPYIGGALLLGLTIIASFLGHKHYSFRKDPEPNGE